MPPNKTGPFVLPILQALRKQAPVHPMTPEEARQRLGGPAPEPASPNEPYPLGAEVWFAPKEGIARLSHSQPAVVLVVEGQSRDVWLGDNRVARTAIERLTARATSESGQPWEAFAPIAGAIQRFAALSAGERVYYDAPNGGEQSGTLREKCRYGALIVPTPGDGAPVTGPSSRASTIMAIGFQHIRAHPRTP